MAGIPCHLSAGSGASASFTRISCFVKFSTLPASATALVDLDGSTTGYVRLGWDPTNQIVLEAAYLGSTLHINITPSHSVTANHWYWMSGVAGSIAGVGGTFFAEGQVWGPGGVTDGAVSGSIAASNSASTPSCPLGWGVPLSSAWVAFPNNQVGTVMTELVIETGVGTQNVTDANGAGVRGVPASALSPGGFIVALYHCTGTVGSNQTITDASGNGYHLTTIGAQGDAIVVDSPF